MTVGFGACKVHVSAFLKWNREYLQVLVAYFFFLVDNECLRASTSRTQRVELVVYCDSCLLCSRILLI